MINVCKQRQVSFTIDRSQKAFTILELILAIVIFSLVGLSLFQILFNGVETYRRAQFTAKLYLNMSHMFDVLDQDLAAMVHFDFSAVDATWLSFQGGKESMRWVMRTSQELKMVQYAIEAENNTRTIKKKIQSLESFIAKHADQADEVIVAKHLSLLEGLELSYAKEDRLIENGRIILLWQNAWHESNLPVAIKVILRYKSYHDTQEPIEFSRIFYRENR